MEKEGLRLYRAIRGIAAFVRVSDGQQTAGRPCVVDCGEYSLRLGGDRWREDFQSRQIRAMMELHRVDLYDVLSGDMHMSPDIPGKG